MASCPQSSTQVSLILLAVVLASDLALLLASVAWLEWVFRKDPQAFALLWGDDGIVLDDRFVQPVSRAATDS